MALTSGIATKAYVVDYKHAPFVLRDVTLDEVRPDEVLVEIKYTGICHTDIVVQHGGMPIGSYPAVLGHEGVGIVRHVGSNVLDKALSKGAIVSLSFHSCGTCSACKAGKCGGCPHMTETNFINTARKTGNGAKSPISLPDGTQVHGQFFGQSSLSKLAIVAESCVVRIPSARSDDLPFLAPLSCGYLTGAGTILNVLQPSKSSTVVILGMGAVGLASLMAAVAIGVETVVAVDVLDSKLALSLALGAEHTINTKAKSTDLEAGIKEVCPGGADYIIDTTGVAALHGPAVKALAHAGTLAFVGVPPPTATLQIGTLDFLTSCKRLIGVIEGDANPRELIPMLVDWYHQGRFPIDRISKCYSALSLDQAIADLKNGHVIKPILSWEEVV
ncbi:chaperonin 10-like protein [Coniochaeta sp. 2T2.1]|nr:chaperonin 10-like protein [Coniochaeta sp. 2T2.1]